MKLSELKIPYNDIIILRKGEDEVQVEFENMEIFKMVILLSETLRTLRDTKVFFRLTKGFTKPSDRFTKFIKYF